MKKLKRIILLIGIIFIVYFLIIKEKYPVVDELPKVMQNEYEIVVSEKMNSVTLEKDGEYQSIGISVDNDKTIYVANAVGHNITAFAINNGKNEIYLRKNLFDYKDGNNDKFQLIKVPYAKYRDISNKNIVKVYIDYEPNGYEIREYTITTGEYKTLESTNTTK